MKENPNRCKGRAGEYQRLAGERVIIYYRDARGNPRKIFGRIAEIDGDLLWLENVNSNSGKTWRGAVNCRVCDISVVSTVEGWSSAYGDEQV